MSTAYYAGVVCGVLAVAVICFFLMKFRKAKGVPDARYDERQEALRNRGFKLAYISLVVYLAVYAILDSTEISWCRPGAGLFLGVLLSVMIFIIYCIYNDAYFRVSDKPGFYVILFAALGIVNILVGFVVPPLKGIEASPLLGLEDINFVVGVFTLIVFINVLVKLHLDKRADEN